MLEADVTLLAAFGAGVLSFLSPCCLPIYPSYLSFLTGMGVGEIREGRREARQLVMQHSLAFVAGFSVIWVALGLGASALGGFFREYREWLRIGGGLLVIAMGLVLLFKPPFFLREKRFQFSRKPQGYLGSFAVGIAFSAGWTPCIGPILSAVLAMAATRPGQGAFLLLAYSIGFAVPFLLLAWGLGSARWLARYSGTIEKVGGVLMIVTGLLLVTNQLAVILRWLIDLTGFSGF